ncbi:MAG: AAA family ATPase [Verrucomicrobia bacterium]|nr:MAG: AAA family ATPase [Verrucomicrobiota bacterium]
MPFYADLHVHSKYARATSGDSDLEHMALWAAKKGVTVLGTGDFSHPAWFKEIQEKLVPAEPGLFRLRAETERWCAEQFPPFAQHPTRFLLEVEISTIYKKGDQTRKVHHLHYVPDLATAERFIARLARIGNLNSEGRPILGLDSGDLLEITLEAGDGAYLIPAHIWTPWFAVLGSKSGFDSIEQCYGDLAPHLFALETGLSSDPPMNWRLSQLDRFQLVSNSDAHSPGKIGREACRFDCALDYLAIRHALETGHGYGGTVEFFPEEGKYHLDGHRNCGVRLEPEETRKHGGLCPTCGKYLTVGVMHRVDELADRPVGAQHENLKPYRSLVPLPELLAEIHRVGAGSRKVADAYENLVGKLGSELFILERAPMDELRKAGSTLLAEGIDRMRKGRVMRHAGYDGEYGIIRVFSDDELIRGNSVSLLFDLPQRAHERGERTPPRGLRTVPSPDASAALPTAKAPSAAPEAGALPALLHETPVLYLAIPSDPLAGLDPEQRAAAEITDGPLLIVAGPGTGKTRTLTHRVAHLVTNQGVAAKQILAVTFTNRAANEMRERLERLLPASTDRVLVTTFHGLSYGILREHGRLVGLAEHFRIAGEAERRALLGEELNLSERKAAQWLKRVSNLKRGGPAVPSEPSPAEDGAVRTLRPAKEDQLVLDAYDCAMRERGWLDFDDLIGLAVELLENCADVLAQYRDRFHHVSVDEFQDIDARQYRLVKLLVPPGGNLCVIGDPDQAIYSFRGAEPRFFQQLAADYLTVRGVQLRRNYRSSRAIVRGALQAITPATLVQGRVLEALNADATKIVIHESPSDKAEAEFVVHTIEQLIGGHTFFSLDSARVETGEARSEYSFSDFAVLYRTDAQADPISEALARSGLPFQRHSHAPLVERDEVRDLLAQAREVPARSSVLERLQAALANPRRELRDPKETRSPKPEEHARVHASVMGTGKFEIQTDFVLRFSDLARSCGDDFARFESESALCSDEDLWDPRADRVSLLTLHASKGLEFAVVFIVGCEDGLLPLCFGSDDQGARLDEERRLFFVGMTRARERLFLSRATKRLWRGQLRQQVVSPFVIAIEQELLERSKTLLTPRAKPNAEQLDLFNPSRRSRNRAGADVSPRAFR